MNEAANTGSPVISSSPVLEILSPRPVKRVSFDALICLAAAFEPAPTDATIAAITAIITKSTNSSNRDLLFGSTPEYG
ncbi:hypothetical protein IFR05_016353 [Cadophora sp. M221]|nr:hypothetical protein IFR05_016353 [Cadophora sp. M221]